MGMTPGQFFEAFVEPNLFDCEERPGDIRRAFNAAVSTSHAADHYLEYYKRHEPERVARLKNIGEFVKHLSTLSYGAFQDVRSVSNVYKHLYADAESKYGVHSSVNSSGSIDAVEMEDDPAIDKLQEEYVAASEKNDGELRVVFTRKDGSRSEFLPVLKQAIECLRSVIYGHA